MSDTTNSGVGGSNDAATSSEVADDATLTNAGANETNETDDTELSEGDGGEGSETTQADDTEEIDYEGQKVRVPKVIKDAVLRHADYTRKTQELATQRKVFEASSRQSLADSKEYVDALAQVRNIDARLEQYKDVDWATEERTDPASAAQHWRIFSQLKDARTQAEKSADGAKERITLDTQRQRATRAEEVRQALPKIVQGWSPEMDAKLATYAGKLGLSQEDQAEFVMRNPVAALILHKASQWDEHVSKTATTQRITQQQQTKPASEVGSNKSVVRRDPSKMSTAEWMAWRTKQTKSK